MSNLMRWSQDEGLHPANAAELREEANKVLATKPRGWQKKVVNLNKDAEEADIAEEAEEHAEVLRHIALALEKNEPDRAKLLVRQGADKWGPEWLADDWQAKDDDVSDADWRQEPDQPKHRFRDFHILSSHRP